MKKEILTLLAAFAIAGVTAQNSQQKVFWSEDFSSGKLPQGWILADSSGTQKCEWIVTDQPYPGSFQFNQQQPPIASTSRGFHMQFRPGVMTGEEVTKWNQKKQYPSALFQTSAINCEGKDHVILKFEQTFRWNSWFRGKNAGLYVGVSNDGKTWTEFNVTSSVPAETSIPIPVREEINITDIAANQKNVYLRFFWKNIFSWYWMVDDIQLCEPLQKDVAVIALTSHEQENNVFTKQDTLRVKIRNVGAETINQDFPIKAVIDGKQTIETVVPASKKALPFNAEIEVVFPSVALDGLGSHKIEFESMYPGDERSSNNMLDVKLYASEMKLGKVTGYKKISANEFEFSCDYSKAKLIFYRDDVFRVWLAPDGEFVNPAGDEIVVDYGVKDPKISVSTGGGYYKFETRQCIVRVYKNPMRFALYDKENKKMIFEELNPITFGTKTLQTLKRGGNEFFYGGGMQQGRFSHGGKDLNISITGWDDGECSNPVPFYMSSNGYGVFRNTFSPGNYAFSGENKKATSQGYDVEYSSRLTHNENRFDAFYFYGPSLKNILGDYTDITGKPFMPAMWMLTMGDADAYNKPEQRVGWEQSTPDVITQVADQYIAHDMPRGWILPNDGYGCGYQKLDSVVTELGKRGFQTGLWTENGVDKIAYEVGKCGTRLCKLDVAWVGPGYEFGLNGCKSAFEGIENNTNERGFVWSVCGWAGTQRYSTMWSGDQSSNWDYIKYHIPTISGAGMSAMNAATSDVDGIFGGSARTYTRDLQWKCFTPIIMTMSGWADVDRQPWNYGHPYTSINRDYLRLKMRLNPYAYTYCREAHISGVPMVRAMVLEFPNDTTTFSSSTQYQFMSGEWMLVAPVYRAGDWRENIYFPQGNDWFDYWDGTKCEGGQWLKRYKARLDKCPVFIKAGAIIPMYPDMNYVGEKPTDVLTLEIWPSGETSFKLYEDDGLTRDYKKGEFAETLITAKTARDGMGKTEIRVGAAKGEFKGRNKMRSYVYDIQAKGTPSLVTLDGKALTGFESKAAFDKANEGYYYNKEDRGGRLKVKSAQFPTDKETVLLYEIR